MKYLIIILFLFSTQIYAQQEVFEWQSCLGGTEYENAGYFEDVIVQISDGFLVVTETRSNDGDVQSGLNGPADIWLLKVDFYGNLVWEKTIGGSEGETPYCMLKESDTTLYIFAVTGSNDGDVQSGNHGLADNWLIKINTDGEILWEKTFGGSKNDKRGTIQLTPEGDILVYCYSWSRDGDIGENPPPGVFGFLWLYKVSSQGELLWSNTFGDEGIRYIGDFLQTSDGGYIIVGTVQGNVGCDCNHHNVGHSEHDIWVAKLNSFRQIEWQKCYGGEVYEQCSNIIEDNGGYTLLAHTYSYHGDLDLHHGTSDYSDLWLFKIDKQGNILHSKVLGGSDDELPDAIFKNDQTGGYTIFAHTKSHNFDVSGNHCGQNNYCWEDIWYVEIDSLGEILHQRCYGAWGDQKPGGILKISEGDFIISATASRGNDPFDITCDMHYPYTSKDIWLFELRDCELYPPQIPTTPYGADTVFLDQNDWNIYSTIIANPIYEQVEWLIEPSEAGDIIKQEDTIKVYWRKEFEGQANLSVRSTSNCGESDYCESKVIQVYKYTGIDENSYNKLKTYPNPAKEFVNFQLPPNTKNSTLIITDIYGKNIKELSIIGQAQLQWDCQNTASGVYFYHTEISGIIYRGRIVINK
jgi:hypothetical protein